MAPAPVTAHLGLLAAGEVWVWILFCCWEVAYESACGRQKPGTWEEAKFNTELQPGGRESCSVGCTFGELPNVFTAHCQLSPFILLGCWDCQVRTPMAPVFKQQCIVSTV